MRSQQFKSTKTFVIIAACLGLTILTWLAQSHAAAVQSQPSSIGVARIHELRVERRDLLRQSATFLEVLFKKGKVSAEQLTDAHMELHHAELDLCTNAQERIHVHEQMVETMRWCENQLELYYKAGRVVLSDAVRAKTRRLQAEIELEQARL